MIKIWVDDVRPAPAGYLWCKSVNETISEITRYIIMYHESGWDEHYKIEVIDLDHDAGDYAKDGGDYIKILDWFDRRQLSLTPPFRIHSMNPVGVQNMRRIIQKNGWKEI